MSLTFIGFLVNVKKVMHLQTKDEGVHRFLFDLKTSQFSINNLPMKSKKPNNWMVRHYCRLQWKSSPCISKTMKRTSTLIHAAASAVIFVYASSGLHKTFNSWYY